VALILVSAAMLRSRMFGRVAPWAGTLGNATVPGPYAAVVGLWLLVASVLPLFAWQVQVGRRLLQLGRERSSRPLE
jgi:hypothetical protein